MPIFFTRAEDCLGEACGSALISEGAAGEEARAAALRAAASGGPSAIICPSAEAMREAVSAVREALDERGADPVIYIALPGGVTPDAPPALARLLAPPAPSEASWWGFDTWGSALFGGMSSPKLSERAIEADLREECAAPASVPIGAPPGLSDALLDMDESFSEMLLRKIDERGISDASCYKRANIDRRHFSKIRSDRAYKPSKPTALALAVALELPIDETRDLLRTAGYALSRSDKFDIIVEYFIKGGNYSILDINEALFAYDQRQLGA